MIVSEESSYERKRRLRRDNPRTNAGVITPENTRNYKLERLQEGETFTTSERGNSMTPLIKSGQKHKLAPATWEECEVGDIAYCKVKGRFYTHLVKAKDPKKGLQIGNNKGRINGWTRSVYGRVVEVINQ